MSLHVYLFNLHVERQTVNLPEKANQKVPDGGGAVGSDVCGVASFLARNCGDVSVLGRRHREPREEFSLLFKGLP